MRSRSARDISKLSLLFLVATTTPSLPSPSSRTAACAVLGAVRSTAAGDGASSSSSYSWGCCRIGRIDVQIPEGRNVDGILQDLRVVFDELLQQDFKGRGLGSGVGLDRRP
jgi:hypothetical protein